jgi:hypothetical protein
MKSIRFQKRVMKATLGVFSQLENMLQITLSDFPIEEIFGNIKVFSRTEPVHTPKDSKMSDKVKEQQWKQNVYQSFQDSDKLLSYLHNTLTSIAHRYLDNPQLELRGTELMATGREENMGQALKSSHTEIKEAVKQLAKSIPREQKPALVSKLKLQLIELTADRGKILVEAEVNWDHPEHSSDSTKKLQRRKTFTWDDFTHFRKALPLAIEEVCDLFL